MGLHWTDSFGIAESLCDKYAEQDPSKFVLHNSDSLY